jgi:hypothetical protein
MKTFKITSGTMICSDPCYDLQTWCQGIIEDVRNGEWEASVATNDEDVWGVRVSKLQIQHTEAKLKKTKWERLNFTAGVDSGQFGFFDEPFYRNDEMAKKLPKYKFDKEFDSEEGDKWYRAMCHLTLGKNKWGVLANGVVAESGFGDGSYEVYGQKDKDEKYIGFYVKFI